MRGLLAGAAAGATLLVLAAPGGSASSAAFSLGLVGTAPGAPGVVHLTLRAPPSDGRATIYVPAGWGVEPAQPAGTVVARGTVAAGDVREGGTLAVAVGARTRCGPSSGAVRWAWSGSTPLRVDLAETATDERRLGAYRLDVCASSPLALDLTFARGTFANPAAVGLYKWRAVVTPTRELQAQVPVPHALAVRAFRSRGRLTVRGYLRIEGLREQGARAVVLGGPTRSGTGTHVLGTARTSGAGAFTVRTRARRVRWVWARTLPRPAACATPVARSCSAVVAPAFAPPMPVRPA